MNAEDRLNRALGAPAAPGKDMRFTIEVMRRAEAERFRADAAQRLVRGAGVAALAGLAIWTVAGWAAANADLTLDLTLALGGILGVAGLSRVLLRRTGARAR